jgi:hypothetical protein
MSAALFLREIAASAPASSFLAASKSQRRAINRRCYPARFVGWMRAIESNSFPRAAATFSRFARLVLWRSNTAAL